MPVSRRLGFRRDSDELWEYLSTGGTAVYAIGDGNGAVKVGKTTGHPKERLEALQTGNPRRLVLLAYTYQYTEAEAHRRMSRLAQRMEGEWWELVPTVLAELGG